MVDHLPAGHALPARSGNIAPAVTQKIRLADYAPPAYFIEETYLDFALDAAQTRVASRLKVRRHPATPAGTPFVLNGEAIALRWVRLDGQTLGESQFAVNDRQLAIHAPPETFILDIENTCAPETNTTLSGLYLSKGMFCTQCEAEGFRRITYYADRPDVLSRFRVRIEADRGAYPTLLSNGNLIDAGSAGEGRHFVVWEDPHPKPSYLFALVGGDLACVEDRFVTQSGRAVTLRIYVQQANADKCAFTLDALKRAMRWDEETFGREYDLDTFMIVAVDHFNFGAMENKGLNIFNSAYVLASPETATDSDYEAIESIVAHEYFHNWSGNRVTCRDWFQLCLKEGFTVFRDQEFSADMRSRAVQRIKDVRRLWANQFPEDAGALAHPPRPEEYITIDNFYTATVYEKGAELVRMLKKIIGPAGFRKACDLYFDRHDGEAATVEDFVRAMEDGGGIALSQFRRWYTEAGTPKLTVTERYEAGSGTYWLHLAQETAPTPGQPHKAPRVLPVDFALIGSASGAMLAEGRIDLVDARSEHRFGPFAERPIASVLRGFSAPASVQQTLTEDDRLCLLRHERDLFSRWAASDRMWKQLCLSPAVSDSAIDRFADALQSCVVEAMEAGPTADPAFAAEALRCPSDADLANEPGPIDPGAIVRTRRRVRASIGGRLSPLLVQTLERFAPSGVYSPDAAQAGRRALRNAALGLLAAAGRFEHAEAQAANATNMTDEAAATAILAMTPAADPQWRGRDRALARFYERWNANPLVVNKWLGWRAMRPGEDALKDIADLMAHAAFDLKTPNKVNALIGVFAHQNLEAFHRADGAGYAFFVDQLLIIDRLNPQLAARLSTAFESWPRLEPGRRGLAREALLRLVRAEKLSPNLYEMATRLIEPDGGAEASGAVEG